MKRTLILAGCLFIGLTGLRAFAQGSAPVALSRNISGQPEALYIGTVVAITTEFTDPDGRSDLSNCYLQVGHPSLPITFDLDLKTKAVTTILPPAAPSGARYMSKVSVEIKEDVTNGYHVIWRFYPIGDWSLVSSGIDFAVKAKDQAGNTDGFNRDGRSLALRIPPYGTTLIIHGSSLPSSTTPLWVRTMGRGVADRLGNGRVLEYVPATGSWTPIYSVGSDSSYEEVLLLNWTDESLNVNTGYAEAAADTFVAALISRQLANPGRFLLGRIHTIGHSRGTVVASEMIERLAALSAAGEDTRLFGQAFDSQIDATWLDPHTSGSAWTGNFGDPDVNQPDLPGQGVVVWNNVGVAANYYQNVMEPNGSSFLYLDGEPVPGSRNRNLDGPPQVGIDHSEVHAWYYGTINPSATVDELAAMVAESLAEQAQALGRNAEKQSIPSLDQLRRLISINRPNWYTDRVGIVEGYAHSRRGGRFPFDPVLEPTPDAGKIRRPFWDPIAKGVYNGSFDYGSGSMDVPGWDRHGGGGYADDDNAAHRLVLSSQQDSSGNYKNMRRHNRLYIPKTATELSFSYRVQQADTGQIPNVDHLVISLGTTVIGGGSGLEIWLNSSSADYVAGKATIPDNFKGTVQTLTFEIQKGGAALKSTVWLDAVRFTAGIPASTTTTAPATSTTSSTTSTTRLSTTTTTSTTTTRLSTTTTTSSTRPPSTIVTTTTSTTRVSTSTTTSTTASSTSTTTSATTTSTLRSTLEEPATVQTLSTDPSLGCPGFYIGDVSLAPGAAEGMWGIEIKLTAGERLLQGGLNLGGGFQENGGINGWGAFNIANPRNESQEVNVQVDAQPLDTPGYPASAFGLSVRLVQRVGQNDVPVGSTVTGKPPLQFQRVVTPGFYILEVRSLAGSPRGTFQMAATTKFTDRLGGGFQGGVVVGGYLARDNAGQSLHGYAAFCISEGQAVSFQTYGRPNYAGVGAGNLFLTLKDRNSQIFWQSPISSTTTSVSTSTTRTIPTTLPTTSTTTTRPPGSTTTTTTQGSTTTLPPAVGNLKILFSPNPVADAGAGDTNPYALNLYETNGVGITLTSLTIGDNPNNQLSNILTSNRIEAGGTANRTIVSRFTTPLTGALDRLWVFRGNDDQGHTDLVWRASLRVLPFSSTTHANVNMDFQPNPLNPSDDGSSYFDIALSETNGVGINVTGFTVNGQDVSSYLPPRISARSLLAGQLVFVPGSPAGEYEWVLTGNDDNGHTGLTWRGWQRLWGFIQLVSGVPRQHSAQGLGYIPFQFQVFVPGNATSLSLYLAGPPAPRNLLNMYVRAGAPVGNLGTILPPSAIADFSLANLGNGSLIIDSNSNPRLQAGASYYIIVYSQVTDLPLAYGITATVSGSAVTTTTAPGTSTTTTQAGTTTTRASTSTTMTQVSTTTTTQAGTTTTRASSSTTTTQASTTTTRASTSTVATTSTTSVQTSTTTTTTVRPSFNPNISLSLSSLKAGSVPEVSFTFSQGTNELNLRSAEMLVGAGRLDIGSLTPGKVLGTASVQIPNAPIGPIPVNHVVVSNDGTRVTSKFEASALGLTVKLADGLFENVGSDGVRILVTIQEVNVLGTRAFQDGSTTGSQSMNVPFAVGKVFILPGQTGRTFTATTNFTSVKYPSSAGTASTMQRISPAFTTTP